MQDKPVTLVISDLHVGGGPADPGDDHVYQRNQLVEFLREHAASKEGKSGALELFINGDFLEFAQTATQAFSLVSEDRWCTETESLCKLDAIIDGHPEIFSALQAFQETGNVVTIAAGNHDVDLYWPAVQQRLREAAGARVHFECGEVWVERHGGLLQIAHGHQGDVANSFKNWKEPFVTADWGVTSLEMCPGTLFMVKFVNQLEAEYPFADNLLPVTRLAKVLMEDDKSGFLSVAWLFGKLVGTTGVGILSTGEKDVGEELVARFQGTRSQARRLADALVGIGRDELAAMVPARLSAESLANMMLVLMGRIPLGKWQELFSTGRGTTLGDDGAVTLSAIARANFVDGKQKCRDDADARARRTGAAVLVMGHTHQPDEHTLPLGARYFNPGSWTRYLELSEGTKVTLDELRDEKRYPYRLNCVRVEHTQGRLQAQMTCFDSEVP